jgi:hypothetical protein
MPPVVPLLACALAGVLVGATLAGTWWVVAAVVVVQAVLVLGVVRTDLAPALRPSAAVALVAGVAGAVAVALLEPGAVSDSLTPLAAAVGLGLVAMAVAQLARRDGRDRLTASLAAAVLMLALVAAAGVWVGLHVRPAGPAAMLVALAGLAVGIAFTVFPGPRLLWVVAGTVAATGTGLLVQSYAPQAADAGLGAPPAALVAGTAAFVGWVGLFVAQWFVTDAGLGRVGVVASPTSHAFPVGLGAGAAIDTPLESPFDFAAGGEPSVATRAGFVLLTAALPLVLAAPAVLAVGWLCLD